MSWSLCLSFSNRSLFFFKINLCEAMPNHVNGSEKRTASNVQFGRNELAARYYDTTCNTTYKPVLVPFSKAASHPKSDVPLKYYGEVFHFYV